MLNFADTGKALHLLRHAPRIGAMILDRWQNTGLAVGRFLDKRPNAKWIRDFAICCGCCGRMYRWLSKGIITLPPPEESGAQHAVREFISLQAMLVTEALAFILYLQKEPEPSWSVVGLYVGSSLLPLGGMVNMLKLSSKRSSNSSPYDFATLKFGRFATWCGVTFVLTILVLFWAKQLPGQVPLKFGRAVPYDWKYDGKKGLVVNAVFEAETLGGHIPPAVRVTVTLKGAASKVWEVAKVIAYKGPKGERTDVEGPYSLDEEPIGPTWNYEMVALVSDGRYVLEIYFHPRVDVTDNETAAKLLDDQKSLSITIDPVK